MAKNKPKKLLLIIFVAILLIVSFVITNPDLLSPADENDVNLASASLRVSVFDVGQADSIYIELPDGKNMLIDAGNNADGENICNYLKTTKNVNSISYLVGTHPHEDHIGGLDDVIRNFSIGEIFMPKTSEKDTPTTATYEDVLDAIIEKDYKITTAKAGTVILQTGNLKIDILSPTKEDYDGELNNYSCVIRLKYYDSVALFMGDAEAEVEKELLSEAVDLDADILKLGHHGSSSSTSKNFLEKVSPVSAIISCGKDNKYGHPNKTVLDRLTDKEIDTYRTDISGTIVIYFDTEGYYIKPSDNICLDGNK